MSPSSTSLPSPQAPHKYPRRILLASMGKAPQILTETLYALATARPAFRPTELHVVTTADGAEVLRALLHDGADTPLAALRNAVKLTGMRWDEQGIHVLRDASNALLTDIRSVEDNQRAADDITRLVQTLTSDPQSALHVSIAGGRKTMGYYLGYALSLFGRAQDRLSHVLVSEQFEGHPEFYFPSQPQQQISTRNGEVLDCADAMVTLATIPFVRLADGLPQPLLKGNARFSELVNAAQAALEPVTMKVWPEQARLEVNGHIAMLTGVTMAFLMWFVQRLENGLPPYQPVSDGESGDQQAAKDFLAIFEGLGLGGADDRPIESLRRGMDRGWCQEQVKQLKRRLETQLGIALAARCQVQLVAKKPALYSLPLSPEQIEVIWSERARALF